MHLNSLRASAGLLAAGGASTGHVTLHVLLTYFQTGPLAFASDASLVGAGCLYVLGTRRLSEKGRAWPAWCTVAFLSGLALIFVAVGSGLAAYDDLNLSAHMVQHVLLMMLAPALIALSRPVTLIAQASGRRVQVRVLKIVNSRAIGVVSGPIAAVLYYGSMWAIFVTSVYAYSVTHPLFHDATHLYLLIVGYLFWQGVVGLDASRHRTSHAVRLIMLFSGMPVESFLALTILNMSEPIAPGYTVIGTHTGGDVFWITSMLVMVAAIIVAMTQWVKSEERLGARINAQFDRHAELGEPQLSEDEIERLRVLLAPGPPGIEVGRGHH